MFPLVVNIKNLVDDEKCYDVIRFLRWSEGCRCPHCDSDAIAKRGKDDTQPARQRYLCKTCGKQFDDLTGTIFSGHHEKTGGYFIWRGRMRRSLYCGGPQR